MKLILQARRRKIHIDDEKELISNEFVSLRVHLTLDASGTVDPDVTKETYTGTATYIHTEKSNKLNMIMESITCSGNVSFDVEITEFKYHIPLDVPLVKEVNFHNDCWAACAAMLKSWQEKEYGCGAFTLEDIWNLVPAYRMDKCDGVGIKILEEKLGLVDENAAPTPKGLTRMLENYGPVWFQSVHGFIITGIESDGTADNTKLTVIDPAFGSGIWPFKAFINALGDFPIDPKDPASFLGPRLLHWPAPHYESNDVYIKANGTMKWLTFNVSGDTGALSPIFHPLLLWASMAEPIKTNKWVPKADIEYQKDSKKAQVTFTYQNLGDAVFEGTTEVENVT